mgnify:CR=1 FL=1
MRLKGICVINQAVLEHQDDHGVITSFLDLEDGTGSGQGFGPYIMTRKLGEDNEFKRLWIKRILEVVGVNKWEELEGKSVRVDGDANRILAIGHVSEDKWFYPDKEFCIMRHQQ